jgi:ferrous iron transport protein A
VDEGGCAARNTLDHLTGRDSGPQGMTTGGVAAARPRFYTPSMAVVSDIETRSQMFPSFAEGPSAGRTLGTADRGAVLRVRDVVGDDAVTLRLLEMGLTPGVVCRVIGRAPLGDPLEIEVRGYRLSIRRAEAARVAVDPA